MEWDGGWTERERVCVCVCVCVPVTFAQLRVHVCPHLCGSISVSAGQRLV